MQQQIPFGDDNKKKQEQRQKQQQRQMQQQQQRQMPGFFASLRMTAIDCYALSVDNK
jgi:hypothetical protein